MSLIIGAPLDRVDGRLKVTGAATYAGEFQVKDVAHATLVQSTIARGRIARLDTSAAEAAPGVLGVMTHQNAPQIPRLKPAISPGGVAIQTVMPLQGEIIHYAGQHIALLVAESLEQAEFAAGLVHVEYEAQAPRTQLDTYIAEAYPHEPMRGVEPDYTRGDPVRALAEAEIRIEQTYTTPIEHHNPMEPHATIAMWDASGKLTVFDTTQAVHVTRQGLAEALGLPVDQIRVICPFVGGAFGAKASIWPHTILAALAARDVGRPVKLVLTRNHMFTSVGYRSQTTQDLKLGARRDGRLTAIVHHATAIGSQVGGFPETAPEVTKLLYASPNVETRMRLVRLDVGAPSIMRAPGEAPGSFALESGLDELAVELRMDPIELRLRNYAETDPVSGMPWSSKGLRECYAQGAERFGWSQRNLKPRSMRDGRLLVGGVWRQRPTRASVCQPTRRPQSARAAARSSAAVRLNSERGSTP